MVRINVGINPAHLHDKHLGAEYNEILKLLGHVRVSPYPKGYTPTEFTLDRGHINFFKDKLAYIYARWHKVCDECEKRGRLTRRERFWVNLHAVDKHTLASNWRPYTPSQRDFEIIKARVVVRCKQYGFDHRALLAQREPESV